LDKKLLIVLVVALVVILLLPVAVTVARASGLLPDTRQKVAIPNLPPELDAKSLENTVWEIEPQRGIRVQVTLKPGGEAVAWSGNPLVKQLAGTDMLSGTWRVEGNKLIVGTVFRGKTYQTDLVIAGKGIYAREGIPINRIR